MAKERTTTGALWIPVSAPDRKDVFPRLTADRHVGVTGHEETWRRTAADTAVLSGQGPTLTPEHTTWTRSCGQGFFALVAREQGHGEHRAPAQVGRQH